MANTDLAQSFRIITPGAEKHAVKWPCAASYAGKPGDAVFIDSNGRATATAGITLGIQVSTPYSVATLAVETTASATAGASEILLVVDPNVEFVGQISTFAVTDPYTTRSSAACYDVAGSAGAYYINAAASTNDTFKIVRVAEEVATGKQSEVGAYAKVVARFNPVVHFLGSIA